MTASISGLPELVKNLDKLRKQGEKKAANAGARAAARELAKGIRSAIPGRYRDAKRAIGTKVRTQSGVVVAKVGAGVGKRNKTKRRESGRGGVGLSKANIHWAILGVKTRKTKAGKNRGRHEGFLAGVVQAGASGAQIRAVAAAQSAIRKELAKRTFG